MANKSGVSHAVAVVLTLLAADLLLSVLRPSFPAILEPLERGAENLTFWLSGLVGRPLDPRLLVPGLVAMVLAFAWGILYHKVRHGSD